MELAGIEMRVKMVEKRTRENEKKWKVSKVMQKGVEAFFVISSSAFRLPSQILYSHKVGGIAFIHTSDVPGDSYSLSVRCPRPQYQYKDGLTGACVVSWST